LDQCPPFQGGKHPSTSLGVSVASKKSTTRRYRLLLKGKTILTFLMVEQENGMLAMPAIEGPKPHLHIYLSDGRLHRHVTHEKYPQGHGRRHTQKRSV